MTEPDRRTGAVTAAFVLLYVLLRVWNLSTFCLDSDEVFSVAMARLSFHDLWARVAGDLVHPPLSYLLLKVWIALGDSQLLWVRLLPLVCSLAALVPVLALLHRLDLRPRAQAFALAFIAVNEYQVYHARYVRMYGLFFLLGVLSLWLFLWWMEEGGWKLLAPLTAVNIALVYTHYYGWTLVIAQAAALLFWHRKRLAPFAASCAVAALAFAPWAAAVLESRAAKRGLGPNLGWFTRPSPGDLLWFYAGLDGPLAPIPIASVIVLLATPLVILRFPRGDRRMRVLALMAAIPPMIGFAVSYAIPQSVWGNRHLIIAAVPYIVLLAVALTSLETRWLRRAAFAIAIVWLTWGGVRAAFFPDPMVDMRTIAQKIADRSIGQREVAVYSLDPFLPAWLGYHLEPYTYVKWDLSTIKGVDETRGGHFWLFYNEKFWHHPQRPEQLLRERGYRTGVPIRETDEWNRLVLVELTKAN